MTLIRPFKGLRPVSGRANEVAAPPYDVLNTQEARERASGKPWSFLHISKPEIDLPEGTNPFDDAVYQQGKTNLDTMLQEGLLKQDEENSYYVYQLTMGDHVQTGLVAVASVPDYNSNRIRKHEFTRPDKEDDRVKQVDTLNAQTGPVFLTYKHSDVIDNIVNDVKKASAPDVNIVADDGVRHVIWAMKDSDQIKTVTDTFDAMDALYIADGHHRSAAASRVSAMREAHHPDPKASHNYFLSVIFPDNQMQILDYNRVITDLNGHSVDDLLVLIENSFTVSAENSPVKPSTSNEFGMYLNGQWYRLNIHTDLIPVDDPVKRLDVSLLANFLIDPILGISDPRRDKRIDFVGGIRGLSELEKRVDSGEMVIAFSLYPTSMKDLMDVADDEQVMPPKSTWFEPKLADGLVSHILD